MKTNKIHGSKIVAALKSNLSHNQVYKTRITRVWCEDGSLHLVTGYEYAGHKDPVFDTIVGYWEIPEGKSYLSPEVIETITRPSFLER